MMDSLGPCPSGHIFVRCSRCQTNFGERFYGNCASCNWAGPLAYTPEEATHLWNTRSPDAHNKAIEEAVKALEADAKLCDCFAYSEDECACGAWCEWKSITSARAVEIVRALIKDQTNAG